MLGFRPNREVNDIDIYYCHHRHDKQKLIACITSACECELYRKTTNTIEIVTSGVYIQFIRIIFFNLNEILRTCTFPLTGIFYNSLSKEVKGSARTILAMLGEEDENKIVETLHPIQIHKYMQRGLLKEHTVLLSRQQRIEPNVDIKIQKVCLFASEEKEMTTANLEDDIISHVFEDKPCTDWPALF